MSAWELVVLIELSVITVIALVGFMRR